MYTQCQALLLPRTFVFAPLIFTIIPNFIPVNKTPSCKMADKFFKAEYSCIGSENTGGALILLKILSGCALIIKFIWKPKYQKKNGNVLQRVFSWRTINFYLLTIQKDLLVASFISLTSLKFSEAPIDMITQSLTVLIFGCQFFYLFSMTPKKPQIEDKEEDEAEKEAERVKNIQNNKPYYSALELHLGIQGHLKMVEGKKRVYYFIVITSTNILIAGLDVFMIQNTSLVIVSITLISLLSGLFSILSQPTTSLALSIFELIVNLLTAVGYGILVAIRDRSGAQTPPETRFTEKQVYSRIGIPIVVLMMLAGVAAALNAILSIYEYSRFRVRKIAEKKNEIKIPDEKVDQAIEAEEEVSDPEIGAENPLRRKNTKKSTRIPYRATRRFTVLNNMNTKAWDQNQEYDDQVELNLRQKFTGKIEGAVNRKISRLIKSNLRDRPGAPEDVLRPENAELSSAGTEKEVRFEKAVLG